MMKKVNVITIKWGKKYSTEDINKLASAIKRNSSYQIDFYCFTEYADGLSEDIIVWPLPRLNVCAAHLYANYRKAAGLCDDNLGNLAGQRVFFFDIDSLIMGNLDELFDYPDGDKFYVINDWAHRTGKKANKVGQASCYSWVVGTLGYIKDYYEAHAQEVIDKFGTATQQYVSAKIIEKDGSLNFWPEEWFKSFRFHCIPRPMLRWFVTPKIPQDKGLKMIAFHGYPNISDAIEGIWCSDKTDKKYPRGLKKLYKHIRPTLWIKEYWK